MRSRLYITLIVGLLVVCVVSTIFAIVYKLPYEFGGIGDPNNVARDALTSGTAISPPVTTLIALAVLAGLSLRRGWLGVISTVGVLILNVLFVIAGSGEPIVWRMLEAGSFGFVEVVVLGTSAITFAMSLGLIVLCVKNLIDRSQARLRMLEQR